MTEIMRLLDADEAVLETRIARATAEADVPWAVARFTYWYTGRPPVHEAVLMAPAG